MTDVKVLAVVSEIFPFVKTGGLADVAGALPQALRAHGIDMRTLVPGYPGVLRATAVAKELLTFDDLFGGTARLLAVRASGLDLLVLDAPHLFDRPGTPYAGPDGRDWPDNAQRFAALSWVAARIGFGDVKAFVPDIVHGHDWQAGLTMAYLAYEGCPRPATIITIHNLAYQGQYPSDLLASLRLPEEALSVDGVEHYGSIGFLKSGLQLADRITTVSPTYAKEIQTPSAGFGLDGLLRWRSPVLQGICNGIDVAEWDPNADPRIASRFSSSALADRAPNKAELQRRFGIGQAPKRLLFGIVTRLVWQKGIDLVADTLQTLLEGGGQLVVLGSGDAELEQRLTSLAKAHPGQIGCVIGYDEDLAHLVQAGADAVLIPSRFEPCGLTQLCAMRYGAIPIASRVGGLADTILDHEQGKAATGFLFSPVSHQALSDALRQARDLWAKPSAWRRMQLNGMQADVSWASPAKAYAALYRDCMKLKK